MIEEPSVSDKTENTSAQILATKVGIIGALFQFVLHMIQIVAQALSIGMGGPTFLQLVVSLLFNPLLFTTGLLVSVGFVGIFALKRRGIIGLLFLLYFLIMFNPQFYISALPIVVLDIIPLVWAILYSVTLLTVINRVTNKILLLSLTSLQFVSYFSVPLINLVWDIGSMPLDNPLDFLIMGLPFIAFHFLLQSVTIAFFIVESRVKSESVHV
ncbi:MAG: hypothetical protein ACW98U_12565 [Candidatus Thorarchaeota archaeon]